MTWSDKRRGRFKMLCVLAVVILGVSAFGSTAFAGKTPKKERQQIDKAINLWVAGVNLVGSLDSYTDEQAFVAMDGVAFLLRESARRVDDASSVPKKIRRRFTGPIRDMTEHLRDYTACYQRNANPVPCQEFVTAVRESARESGAAAVALAPYGTRTADEVRVLLLGNNPSVPATVPPPTVPPTTAPPQVVYEITGTASSVSITLTNESGGTEQFETPVPFSRTLNRPPTGFVYIAAQNQGGGGDVTCTIKYGDRVVQTATSSGAYVIATCSGSVGSPF